MCYLLKDQRTRILLSTNKACSPIFSSSSSPFFLRKKKTKINPPFWSRVSWFSCQGIMPLYCQPNQVLTFSLCLPDSYLLISLTCFLTWLAICSSHLLWCISLDSVSCDYLINNSILYGSFRKSSTAAGQTRMWCWAWIWSSV